MSSRVELSQRKVKMMKKILLFVVLLAVAYCLVYVAHYANISEKCLSYGVHEIRVDPDFESFCRYRLKTGTVVDRPMGYYEQGVVSF
jgi:hypothetical protein